MAIIKLGTLVIGKVEVMGLNVKAVEAAGFTVEIK